MSFRQAILPALLAVSGCHGHDDGGLYYFEEAYLTEDVTDLMTIVFATGENAYLGDAPDPADVTQLPDASNRYTVVYDLPDAFRPGLGPGSGAAALQVSEDGAPNPDPLSFSFAATAALSVELVYEISYVGLTTGSRETDVIFQARLLATRATSADPFLVEYVADGTCFLGTTFCDFNARFRAPGPPSAGIEPGFGDGAGNIDDPDVYDVFRVDVDFGNGAFRAQGPVGCCAYYDADFFYDQFFF